jgi:spore coat polysaccharide biosynthesis protein SpsF
LIDPGLIDAAVDILAGDKGEFSTQGEVSPAFDFVANRLPPPYPRTYPIGLDVEICTFDALERAWQEARDASDREHVMPYLYRGVTLAPVVELLRSGMSPSGFRVAVLDCAVDLGTQRWTVDTGEDLDFVNQVYSHFSGRSDFSWLEVLELLRRRPDLLTINADIRHKALGEVDPRAIGHDGR